MNGIAASCSKDLIQCKPVAASGMFLWLEVNLEKHPEYRTNVRETSGDSTGPQTNTDELMQKLFELAIEGEHLNTTVRKIRHAYISLDAQRMYLFCNRPSLLQRLPSLRLLQK